MEQVQSGALKDLWNGLKSFSNKLFENFNKLLELGMKITDENTSEAKLIKNTKIYKFTTPSGKQIQVEITPTSTKSVFDVVFKDKNNNIIIKKDKVKDSEFEKVFTKVIKEQFGEDMNKQTTVSAKKLSVKFEKVLAKTGYDIAVSKIMANYNATEVLDDINTMLDNDEFINQFNDITDDSKCFEISSNDSDLDIVETDEINTDETYDIILTNQVFLYHTLQSIHWNVTGSKFYDIHLLLDNLITKLQYEIDLFAELSVEKTGYVPNLLKLIFHEFSNCNKLALQQDSWSWDEIDGTTAAEKIYNMVQTYLDVLHCYYCNFESDVQSEIDTIIRYWSVEVNYKLKQFMR